MKTLSKIYLVFFLAIVMASTNAAAQLNKNTIQGVPGNNSIQFVGGFCKRGFNDIKGVMIGFEYTNYLSRKFSLTYNGRATSNSDKDEIIYDNGGGSTTDASVRLTIAGIQLGVNGGWSLVNSPQHEFMIKLGAFGRYQSTSNGDDTFIVYYPITTGIPAALVAHDHLTPHETIAVGGIFQLQYNFTFKNGLFLGLQPGFQVDTIDEAFIHAALVFGKRF
jgi:hypothetical protein